MPDDRDRVARLTSAKLHGSAPALGSVRAVIGLDGFVDEIIAVVDKRHSFDDYEPIHTIAALGQKVLNAAGQSSNYELVPKQMKLGGNGPIMANALANLGLDVTYVGSLGYPAVHPVFADMAARCKVISIAEPGHTDALEFDDGKLMLGKVASMADVSWPNLVGRVGLAELGSMVDASSLFGFVNWTMLPHMSDIWQKVQSELVPGLSRRPRKMFVDLADPEKRSHADIAEALKILSKFQGAFDVMLGLNLKEAGEITDVLGLPTAADAEADIESTAKAIRQALGVYCCVVHPRGGAAAATAGESARFAGPFVRQPKISTGAGDHFNAGFATGQVLGFGLAESLCVGVATSGYYVRTGNSPSAAELADFVAELPPPQ